MVAGSTGRFPGASIGMAGMSSSGRASEGGRVQETVRRRSHRWRASRYDAGDPSEGVVVQYGLAWLFAGSGDCAPATKKRTEPKNADNSLERLLRKSLLRRVGVGARLWPRRRREEGDQCGGGAPNGAQGDGRGGGDDGLGRTDEGGRGEQRRRLSVDGLFESWGGAHLKRERQAGERRGGREEPRDRGHVARGAARQERTQVGTHGGHRRREHVHDRAKESGEASRRAGARSVRGGGCVRWAAVTSPLRLVPTIVADAAAVTLTASLVGDADKDHPRGAARADEATRATVVRLRASTPIAGGGDQLGDSEADASIAVGARGPPPLYDGSQPSE